MTLIGRKRFWREATVTETGGAFGVALDSKPVNTPRAVPLRVPSRELAEAIAAEWNAVEGELRPEAMPLTRVAVAAIDQVAPAPEPLVELVAAYAETDLICYRAAGPEGLCRRQATLWDPMLAWAERSLGARLVPVAGVMHRPQPAGSMAALRAAVAGQDPFRLAGLAELVALSGSLIIGLAVARGALEGKAAWPLSRVDEDWQAEQWGEDAEAADAAARRRAEFLSAERYLRLLGA